MSDRSDEKWLDQHTREWVEAGLVSEHQADEIVAYELPAEPVAPPRLTIVAEVASYLGSVLMFAGGAAIVGPNWDRLGLAGQIAIAAAIAIVGLGVGAWLVAQGEAGMTRLGTFLWVVGTGGVALGVAAVVNEVDPSDDAWFPTLIGVPLLVVGTALWRNLDRPLQLLTAAAGIWLVAGGVIDLSGLSIWIAAPVVWLLSLGWGWLAASGRVHPRLVAMIIAAVGLMVASFALLEESEWTGSIAAMASAAMIVTFALVDRSWPLVAVGVFAFFMAVTMLMDTVLHGTVARLVAVVLGLIVVAAVAFRAQGTSHGGRVPR